MSGKKSLYEQVLAGMGSGSGEAAPPGLPPSRPPRASGAVVLWRKPATTQELEVYWVQRSEKLRFMGGWHAFPGGTLHRRDPEIRVDGDVQHAAAASPTAAMPEGLLAGVEELEPILAPGVVAAALRELFEEVGLLVGPSVEGAAEVRRGILDGATDAHDWAAEVGLRFDASSLEYAGRWLTPPLGPIRFDNRFFLLEWPEDRADQPNVIPGELAEGEWITPQEALDHRDRGDVFLAPPIRHILEVLAEDGPSGGRRRLEEPFEANVGPYRRVEFRPGVLLFPLKTPTLPPATHTNTYVLGRRRAVVVDPGTPIEEDIEGLIAALLELRAEGIALEAIWLTHHHRDHVGAVERVRRALDLPVCAHELAAEHLGRMGIAVDRLLAEGDRVELGDADDPFPVRVLHTPGHARGHLCFYDERFGSLVSGDIVAGVGTIVIDPPEGNMKDYLATLERLEELAPTALFPGHGPTIRGAVAKLNQYRRHRLWREERVLKAWRDGVKDPAEMIEKVYEDVPAVAHPLAVRQILAHIEHLKHRGEIEN